LLRRAHASAFGWFRIDNICRIEGFAAVAFFSIENNHVTDNASILQEKIHVLRSHAGFGQLR